MNTYLLCEGGSVGEKNFPGKENGIYKGLEDSEHEYQV